MRNIVHFAAGSRAEWENVSFKDSGWLKVWDGDDHNAPNRQDWFPPHAVERVTRIPEDDE